jgi:protein-arginine kinase activator protein McsA
MLDMTNETNLAVVQAARERLEQEKAIHQEEAEDAARVNDLINELLQMISEADDERDAEA